MAEQVFGSGKLRELEPKRVLALFVFGAIVISILDGFHTHSGTTRYASPIFLGAAWWTPVIFGATAGLGGPAISLLYFALGGKREPPSWTALAIAFVIFTFLYAFSGYYGAHATTSDANGVKLVVLGASGLAVFSWLDRTWQGFVCALATAATGPLVEIVLVHAGAFVHLQPDFLGIPRWLPALYFCSAPVLGQGARRFLFGSPREAA